ncbi:hypothetical protein KJ910_03515 [Patescibacteria group bacterium]|nr:hypothetical protein [Patescibacteria group bacterium]MBU1907166.1 hypothetical protein [Patescibacteria group bacterium]
MARTDLYDAVRSFFIERGYLEVETPLMVRSPGMEPNLDPFVVFTSPFRGAEKQGGKAPNKYALITSPEYSMKKLLGAGLEKIFTITKVFRSGESETSEWHNPEFSMLEWYEQGTDYIQGMEMTEQLVVHCAERVARRTSHVDLTVPWPRYRVRDLMLEHAGIDLDEDPFQGNDQDSPSDQFYRVWLEKVEPNLPKDRAFFIYDYPIYQAALARTSPDGKYAERFEAYLGELELCNAFTELVDPVEQRRRFEIEAEERVGLGKPVWPIDEELLKVLPSIREPTFGNALGLDRLLMGLMGVEEIDGVLLIR